MRDNKGKQIFICYQLVILKNVISTYLISTYNNANTATEGVINIHGYHKFTSTYLTFIKKFKDIDCNYNCKDFDEN